MISAGTLGCFVRRPGAAAPLIVSNNHVLANTDQAALGDPMLAPGPGDGGRPGLDEVARLVFVEPLREAGNRLDLAAAELIDPARLATNDVDGGPLTGVEDPLDGVLVEYGEGVTFSFDDTIEVESPDGASPRAGTAAASSTAGRTGRRSVCCSRAPARVGRPAWD